MAKKPAASPPGAPLIYSSAEAARRIHPNLSPRTLERWRSLGTGPAFVKVGARVGYTDEAIHTYHAQRTRTHTRKDRAK